MTELIQPIHFNFENIRAERQKVNNRAVYESLVQQKLNKKSCNEEELKRVLEDLDFTEEQLLVKCSQDHTFAKLLARDIAKNASRQGSKDENTQLDICNITASKFGVKIEDLPNFALRPTKDGRIITKKEFDGMDKNSCLKSFDGKISGALEGWIFAKVVFGNGGHQDNVFEEAHNFGEWVLAFGNTDHIYVLLIDTNLATPLQELKTKYQEQKNLLVVNHIEFQQYIIDKFSTI
jgi:hypothetical protein